MDNSNNFKLYDFHKMLPNVIQLTYSGPFGRDFLTAIGKHIRITFGANIGISNKIFSIFMELTQNISYYSAQTIPLGTDTTGVGTIVICEFDDHYSFVTGNVVVNDDVISVIEKCEIINSLDREGLRQYKRDQRRQPRGTSGGANIGLIQVALTSSNPLDFEVIPIDEKTSFFSIGVKINKTYEK